MEAAEQRQALAGAAGLQRAAVRLDLESASARPAMLFPARNYSSSNYLSNRSTASGAEWYTTSLSWRLSPVRDQFAEPVRSSRPSMA